MPNEPARTEPNYDGRIVGRDEKNIRMEFNNPRRFNFKDPETGVVSPYTVSEISLTIDDQVRPYLNGNNTVRGLPHRLAKRSILSEIMRIRAERIAELMGKEDHYDKFKDERDMP